MPSTPPPRTSHPPRTGRSDLPASPLPEMHVTPWTQTRKVGGPAARGVPRPSRPPGHSGPRGVQKALTGTEATHFVPEHTIIHTNMTIDDICPGTTLTAGAALDAGPQGPALGPHRQPHKSQATIPLEDPCPSRHKSPACNAIRNVVRHGRCANLARRHQTPRAPIDRKVLPPPSELFGRCRPDPSPPS